MEREIAATVAWDRRRYLNKGELGSWFYFDVVDYADALLEQLGLSSHRQKGWKGNLVEPCFAADLKDIGKEYSRILSHIKIFTVTVVAAYTFASRVSESLCLRVFMQG